MAITDNDTPIKTRVIDAINTAITTVTEIEYVKDRPSLLSDIETATLPAAFLFDGDESRPVYRNRLRTVDFPYTAEIWVDDEDGQKSSSEQMDIWQAKLYAALISDTERPVFFANAGVSIVEGDTPIIKGYVSERIAVAQLKYEVTYRTSINDLYSVNY